MKTMPTTRCAHCRLPERTYRRGRRAGLIRRHFHYWLPGLRRCPGSFGAPYGGAR